MHRVTLPNKKVKQNGNSFNRIKKKPINLRWVGVVATPLRIIVFALIAVGVLWLGGNKIYTLIIESYRPNAKLFEACTQSFTSIKTVPSYGIVFSTNDTEVTTISLVAPVGAADRKSIKISGKDWFIVYFSNNFTFTPVSEFLRLSKLEHGKLDYCYLMEQLSLTSGVPIEFVIVDDAITGLSSTLSLTATREMLRAVNNGKTYEFRQSLLPLYSSPDGSSIPVVTYGAFQEQFPDFFKIEEVAQEQAFVEVYNATQISGYASIIGKKLSMLGIDVSRVNNVQFSEETTAVAVIYIKDDKQYNRTMSLIKSSLPEGEVIVRVGRPPNLVTTGDIVVFLLKR
jgi:hypothetical protein